MTLSEALTALAGNTGINIQLVEVDGTTKTPIITFNAPGYAGVESDLLAKTVDTITINNKVVVIEYAKGA